MGDIDDGLNSYPQSDDALAPDEQPLPNPSAAKAPYRRQTPHITQSPIDDVEPSYVTRERYVTLEQARGDRKHMGTATSDPQYLSPTGYEKSGHLSPNASRERDGGRATVHYERYLQTPKPGKSIFISRQERARKRNRRLLLAAIIVVVVAILLKVFVFH
ncbi:hypothetical protein ACTQY8_04630 [Collinsella bouchesdurhonensis]|uniref:hypothetical protein n=1 Tax=Collinsella bouchesdurhonensis TaxID=1907654 RepID=UPI002A7E3EDD|nr:hypothetical protein [Collinsella bouchesdurhonensis]MDY3053643.1 hypothetical protein [Collinsella bouchesdurhonensis]